MDDKQLTLEEKWKLDIDSYKKSGGMRVTTPQCRKCKYWIKTDALHCDQYQKSIKPSSVLHAEKECPRFSSSDELGVSVVGDTDNRIKGGLWGAIVGDALGVPLEFSDRLTRKKDPIREMRAYGTYSQPFGTWSDDSSMMLCLVESIIEGLSYERLSQKFIDFADTGYMTPYDGVFDIGNAVSKAIIKMKSGLSPIECGGESEYDNGNGSLMRILPLAFFLRAKTTEEQIRVVEDVSSITHRHPISKFACLFYVKMAMSLLDGKDKIEAYRLAIDYSKNALCDSYFDVFQNFERVLNGNIQRIKIDKIQSSGYVIDTLEAALWCFINTRSYSECVFQAINLGGDTDTIACIAGGLAGIHYGFRSIPVNWIQTLAKKHNINSMIDKFIASVQ